MNNRENKITLQNTFTEYSDIVSVNQMIEMLNIGRNAAYKLLNNKEIHSIKIGENGRTHHIPKIEIIEYLNRNIPYRNIS